LTAFNVPYSCIYRKYLNYIHPPLRCILYEGSNIHWTKFWTQMRKTATIFQSSLRFYDTIHERCLSLGTQQLTTHLIEI
jgi:hypothetical protein